MTKSRYLLQSETNFWTIAGPDSIMSSSGQEEWDAAATEVLGGYSVFHACSDHGSVMRGCPIKTRIIMDWVAKFKFFVLVRPPLHGGQQSASYFWGGCYACVVGKMWDRTDERRRGTSRAMSFRGDSTTRKLLVHSPSRHVSANLDLERQGTFRGELESVNKFT